MTVMTPEVQWEVICLHMQKARWDEPELLGDAVEDMRTAWNNGVDRELLMQAATNFGQVSGFTGKVMATTADAIAHEKELRKRQASPAPAVAQAPAQAADAEPEAQSADWREAVAQRKAMLGTAKDEMNAQIKTLRDAYAELERQWDDYVAATREAARKSK